MAICFCSGIGAEDLSIKFPLDASLLAPCLPNLERPLTVVAPDLGRYVLV